MNGENLKNKLKSAGYTLESVSESLGITPQALNSKLNAADLKYSFIEDVAKAINKSVYFLIDTSTAQNSEVKKKKPALGIPLIPVEALAGQGAGELVITDKDIEERFVVPEFTKADYLIRIKGSSMYPKFTAGDIVACQRIGKDQWGYLQWGKAFIIDSDQGVMIKRLFESKKKLHWTLRSDNKDYPDMEMPILAIYNVSMVVGLIRSE